MKLYQIILTWMKRRWCAHLWKRLKWYGIANEPNLVECVKCGWITKDKFLLPQMYLEKTKCGCGCGEIIEIGKVNNE